jgi:hypothetical protein
MPACTARQRGRRCIEVRQAQHAGFAIAAGLHGMTAAMAGNFHRQTLTKLSAAEKAGKAVSA